MVAKQRLDQVRSRLERLRRDALEMVTSANKVVFNGVQRLADQELKTLNRAYNTALRSLQTARAGGNLKHMTAKQLDALQEIVNQVIASARQSLAIVAETRTELADLIRKGGNTTAADVRLAVAPAKRGLRRVNSAARRGAAGIKKPAAKTSRKPARKTVPRKSARSTARRPSPNSRASRATSRAKHAAPSPAMTPATPPSSAST
ncbi:MAG: TIGR01841 family phasin [Gammaproteobacteria bacterium]|nr:TIGR01841 family phasin [Gammaproteobacteria bacterium]